MQDENNLEEQVGLGTMPPEFVPVAFAANREEAKRVRDILESFNIPALSDDGGVDGCADAVLGRGLPVLVPEHLHDRASDVIAELESAASGGIAPDSTEEKDEDYVEEGDGEDDEEGDDDVDGDFDELDDDLDEDFEDEDFDDGDDDDDDELNDSDPEGDGLEDFD